ncbi:MAG: hypothetical protein WA414_00660 [Acidobacteriaceae bacterium]|jgi:pectin methylesterase-like acyl-CoA thioesterase
MRLWTGHRTASSATAAVYDHRPTISVTTAQTETIILAFLAFLRWNAMGRSSKGILNVAAAPVSVSVNTTVMV